jgi:hypothetical protein
MTPDVVGTLDYWAECLSHFPPVGEDLARLVKRYREALLTL